MRLYKYIKDEENKYKCECCDGFLPIVINDNVPNELLSYVFAKNYESNIMFV